MPRYHPVIVFGHRNSLFNIVTLAIKNIILVMIFFPFYRNSLFFEWKSLRKRLERPSFFRLESDLSLRIGLKSVPWILYPVYLIFLNNTPLIRACFYSEDNVFVTWPWPSRHHPAPIPSPFFRKPSPLRSKLPSVPKRSLNSITVL